MAKNVDPSPVAPKMQQSELDELNEQAKAVALHDFHLGSFLLTLVRHLGSAHGLEVSPEAPVKPEEPAKAEGE